MATPPKTPQMAPAAPKITPPILLAIFAAAPEKFLATFRETPQIRPAIFLGLPQIWVAIFVGQPPILAGIFGALRQILAAMNRGCPSIIASQMTGIIVNACLNIPIVHLDDTFFHTQCHTFPGASSFVRPLFWDQCFMLGTVPFGIPNLRWSFVMAPRPPAYPWQKKSDTVPPQTQPLPACLASCPLANQTGDEG